MKNAVLKTSTPQRSLSREKKKWKEVVWNATKARPLEKCKPPSQQRAVGPPGARKTQMHIHCHLERIVVKLTFWARVFGGV